MSVDPASAEWAALCPELVDVLFSSVPNALVYVDNTGAIVRANAEALRILGLSLDELTQRVVGQFAPETIHLDGRPFPVSEYPVSKVLATGQPQSSVLIGIKQHGGTTYWAEFVASPVKSPTGALAGALVIFHDVTKVVLADQARADSEALLQSVLHSAPDIILTANLEGTILYINRTVAPLTVETVVGKSIYDMINPDDKDRVSAVVKNVLSTGQTEDYDILIEKTAPPTWFSVRVGPVKRGEKIIGFTMITRDITQRNELETRLRISDRMAAVGQLVAGVAHEINNPLAYVLGNLELIRNTLNKHSVVHTDQLHSFIAAALDGTERIRSLIRDLNRFSNVRHATALPIDIHESLESAVRMAQSAIHTRARVQRSYQNIPLVKADPAQLSQVFLNLLVNAAQALSPEHAASNEIRVTTGIDGSFVTVQIEDNGAGISPETLTHIFDPFFTTKTAGEGTGLGLHICKNTLNELGGSISVQSTVGEGTLFEIRIPVFSAPSTDTTNANTTPADTTPGVQEPKRILIVDDEPFVVELLSCALSHHQVECANHGEEAISKLKNQSYDLVLCDVLMPIISGFEVLSFIRAQSNNNHPIFIFMTGGILTESEQQLLIDSNITCLRKPFSMTELVQIIEDTILVRYLRAYNKRK